MALVVDDIPNGKFVIMRGKKEKRFLVSISCDGRASWTVNYWQAWHFSTYKVASRVLPLIKIQW